MWIDMFPLENLQDSRRLPKAVNITPRKPKKFQLRVIIYNTEEVVLDDINMVTGEKTSDIYIKGFFGNREEDAQKTDTHYRSLNGEGNFNWRFIFDFEYLPNEEKIVYTQKHTFSLYTTEIKVDPICKRSFFFISNNHIVIISVDTFF
jgi:hypothetical protein